MARPSKSEENVVRLRSDDDLRVYIDTLSGHGPLHEAIIEVDRDDDLTSVRSKLESVSLPRAVLVIPSNAKTLREALEFRVLRRLQRELGLELILVSNDLTRRGFARENGFRNVFSSLKAYQRNKNLAPQDNSDGIPFTDPEEFNPALGVSRWGVLVGGILLAILAVIAYFAVPVYTVTVYPQYQTLTRDVVVLVEIGGPRTDTTAQRLSGRAVQQQVQVQGSVNVKDVQPAPPPPSGNNPPPTGFVPGRNVTLEVRDALRARLLQQAQAQAMERLKTQLLSNESLPEASIHTEITAEKYDHNVGDVADSLNGQLEIVATGLAFNNDDFNTLVEDLWSQDIPRDFKATGTPTLTPPAVVNMEGQHMQLRVRAEGQLVGQVDNGTITNTVRGRTPAEAQQLFAKMTDFTQPPQISLWPEWASRAFRVQVKQVAEPTAAPQKSQGGNGN